MCISPSFHSFTDQLCCCSPARPPVCQSHAFLPLSSLQVPPLFTQGDESEVTFRSLLNTLAGEPGERKASPGKADHHTAPRLKFGAKTTSPRRRSLSPPNERHSGQGIKFSNPSALTPPETTSAPGASPSRRSSTTDPATNSPDTPADDVIGRYGLITRAPAASASPGAISHRMTPRRAATAAASPAAQKTPRVVMVERLVATTGGKTFDETVSQFTGSNAEVRCSQIGSLAAAASILPWPCLFQRACWLPSLLDDALSILMAKGWSNTPETASWACLASPVADMLTHYTPAVS